MTSAPHRYHPDTMSGDPEDAVLYDDCERCDQHAAHPGDGLDAGNLWALYNLPTARTRNERLAMTAIGVAVRIARIIDAEADRRKVRAEWEGA